MENNLRVLLIAMSHIIYAPAKKYDIIRLIILNEGIYEQR